MDPTKSSTMHGLRVWKDHWCTKGSLETDTSHSGLWAVLSQEFWNVARPVAYPSWDHRPTKQSTATYRSMNLELLALKWAITENFREYLLGQKCIMLTDNNPWKVLRRPYKDSGNRTAYNCSLTMFRDKWLVCIDSWPLYHLPSITHCFPPLEAFPICQWMPM